MRDLLLQGHPLAVLVRSTKRETACKRIESVVARFEENLNQPLPRPVVIEADVCQPDLRLNKHQIQWISENCWSILHNAAALQFFGSSRDEEPWRTNFGGTKNILELARIADIEQFHHVSTAYVCGRRTEDVLETDLDCCQSFRNDYEHSKFAAEQLVRSSEHLKSTTVYRPVVIAGDSRTGYTCTYHGLFLYLRLIATLVPLQRRNENGLCETPIKLPLDGNEPRNLVTVDWVSEVISHLFSEPAAHGLTFHLSPDHCITTREFIDYCCEYFHSCGVEYIGRDADRVCDSDFAARLFENVKIYQAYETSDPHFDKTNLLKFAGHIRCPRIDKETIFKFIEFGQAHGWGKKRQVPITSANRVTPLVQVPL
jgi:thioester reductase-like protein